MRAVRNWTAGFIVIFMPYLGLFVIWPLATWSRKAKLAIALVWAGPVSVMMLYAAVTTGAAAAYARSASWSQTAAPTVMATARVVAAASTPARPTPNPGPPTVVPRATAAPTSVPKPTATPPPPEEVDAKYVDPRELAADPKGFIGENVFVVGRALNVEQVATKPAGWFDSGRAAYTWMNLMARVRGKSQFTTEPVVIEFGGRLEKALRDECFRVFGVVGGTQTVKRSLTGADNEVVFLRGYAAYHITARNAQPGADYPCPEP